MESAKGSSKAGSSSAHTADDELLDSVFQAPPEVLRRVNALKNLHIKLVDIESKFYEELHHLECKYAAMYVPIFEQREKIVNGKYEPTDEESKFEFEHDCKSDDCKHEKPEPAASGESKAIGVPEFWLNSLKSTELIREMIQEHDEPVLKHLTDVKVINYDEKPYGYTLEFHFSENEYFTNKVLTKRYWLTTDKDETDPLIYDGPIIYKCAGTKIEWNKDKDVTTKLVKKKQKHKSSGTIRIVNKTEKQDSFFNFFEAPTEDGIRPSFRGWLTKLEKGEAEAKKVEEEADEEIDEENEALYEADFEIGHFIKEFLIPKAVLYFTGEISDENGFEDEEEDEEDDYEEGEDDDADDEDLEDVNPEDEQNDEDKKKSKTKNNQ